MATQNKTLQKDQKSFAAPKQIKRKASEASAIQEEEAIRELENMQRRIQAGIRQQFLTNDKRFQYARLFYILAVGIMLAGSSLIIHYSFVRSRGESTVPQYETEFQILGGFVVGLGLAIFMIIAAYTYHRENVLRRRQGLPSVYESSVPGMLTGESRRTSLFSTKGSLLSSTSECTDENEKSFNSLTTGFSRWSSKDCPKSHNLGDSFTSESSKAALIHTKNEPIRSKCEIDELSKRIARFKKDKNLSKARLLAWQKESFSESKTTSSDWLNKLSRKETKKSAKEYLSVFQHYSVNNNSLSDIEEMSGSSPVLKSFSSDLLTVSVENSKIDYTPLLESTLDDVSEHLPTECNKTEKPHCVSNSEFHLAENNSGNENNMCGTAIPVIIIEEWPEVEPDCD